MNIDQQLAALLTSLDDVLDLERGLADATLSRAHAELVAGLADALDLAAGLADVVQPPPLAPLERLAAFADELAARPAAERLAARSWLSVSLPTEAYALTTLIPTVRDLTVKAFSFKSGRKFRSSAQPELWRLVHGLEVAGLQGTQLHQFAHAFLDTLGHSLTIVEARRHALTLNQGFAERHANLLREIDRRAHGSALAQRVHSGLVDVAFAGALLGPLSQLVSALTSVVGADLTSADLAGLSLDGVRWSSDTRWPEDWEAWVRDNSVPITDDVFEIRPGKAGSWLPT
ncbi:hypothetical protein [Lentzea terrae]|uniref:hypothetical protein n=1 Tax=Lentzea terrae TaxID=2200761 RepID=UPI000DD36100|nr:hypothetical protein [Lentzea terrae]